SIRSWRKWRRTAFASIFFRHHFEGQSDLANLLGCRSRSLWLRHLCRQLFDRLRFWIYRQWCDNQLFMEWFQPASLRSIGNPNGWQRTYRYFQRPNLDTTTDAAER